MVASNALSQAQQLAADGLSAFSQKMKVISKNLSNAESTGSTPGAKPYARQQVILGSGFNKEVGTETVKVKSIQTDTDNFIREYLPDHPAADAQGYVLKPNVNPIFELTNMMEATRDYERVLKAYKETTTLKHQTIALMR